MDVGDVVIYQEFDGAPDYAAIVRFEHADGQLDLTVFDTDGTTRAVDEVPVDAAVADDENAERWRPR